VRPVHPGEHADAGAQRQGDEDGGEKGERTAGPARAFPARRRARLPLVEEGAELAVGVEVGTLVAALR
jgi:hypothetical protein